MQMMCQALTTALLQHYLERSLLPAEHACVKTHLDHCQQCWGTWNRFRWYKARGTRGYAELQAYLGDAFEEDLDSSWELAHDWDRRHPQTPAEIEAFYRETPYYLYNLLIWHESGNRPPYVTYAEPFLHTYHCRVICDVGCGIGNDGLLLLAKGYTVILCEFDNPSSRFLRWRLQQRNLDARWIQPHEIASLAGIGVDTLWTMDVLDHLPDPQAVLHPLLEQVQTFFHEPDIRGKAHGCQRFHLHHEDGYVQRMCEVYGLRRDTSSQQVSMWHR
ncbi:MAG: class I SAM-dependent methyltransferase [Ktedonobacteraceae bacterium]